MEPTQQSAQDAMRRLMASCAAFEVQARETARCLRSATARLRGASAGLAAAGIPPRPPLPGGPPHARVELVDPAP